MLLDEVIEHRWPDLVVPLQRAAAVEASMEFKPKSRHAQNAAGTHEAVTARKKIHKTRRHHNLM